jgi:hypothetical protein
VLQAARQQQRLATRCGQLGGACKHPNTPKL